MTDHELLAQWAGGDTSAGEALFERHFGREPMQLPVLTERLAVAELPTLHLALEAYLGAPGRRPQSHGIGSRLRAEDTTLGRLAAPPDRFYRSVEVGPMPYINVTLMDDARMACVGTAVFLAHEGEKPVIILQRYDGDSYRKGLSVEVMAAEAEETLTETVMM